jgi:membrane fusion protein, multidrug efflux system
MNRMMFVAFVACATVLTGVAAEADEPNEVATPKAITVEPAAQMRFGVLVTTLRAATAPTGVSTTARVLDPSRLLQLDSELASAAATFTASKAEALRLRKLYTEDRTASLRAVETASAQEQADLQRVNAARRQLALEWGGGIAGLTAHNRSVLLNELAGGHALLARVEVPPGTPLPGVGSGVELRGNSESEVFSSSVVGSLPTADPRLQTRGVLVELKGDAAKLSIGQMLAAQVPTANDPPVAGVILPRSALVRRGARVWVYVQLSPNTFVRREVHDYHPVPGGWFVASGFMAGDRVVAGGAAALLGIEAPAATDQQDPD